MMMSEADISCPRLIVSLSYAAWENTVVFSDREIYQISLAKLITQFPVDITFDDLISTLYCQNHIMTEHHDRADNCFHRTVSLVDYDILRTDCNRAAAIPDKFISPMKDAT